MPFPPNGQIFRGGGFDDSFRGFFTVGKQYRVPGFLATSFSRSKAEEFLFNQLQNFSATDLLRLFIWKMKPKEVFAKTVY